MVPKDNFVNEKLKQLFRPHLVFHFHFIIYFLIPNICCVFLIFELFSEKMLQFEEKRSDCE